jgi:hypothetical protein
VSGKSASRKGCELVQLREVELVAQMKREAPNMPTLPNFAGVAMPGFAPPRLCRAMPAMTSRAKPRLCCASTSRAVPCQHPLFFAERSGPPLSQSPSAWQTGGAIDTVIQDQEFPAKAGPVFQPCFTGKPGERYYTGQIKRSPGQHSVPPVCVPGGKKARDPAHKAGWQGRSRFFSFCGRDSHTSTAAPAGVLSVRRPGPCRGRQGRLQDRSMAAGGTGKSERVNHGNGRYNRTEI